MKRGANAQKRVCSLDTEEPVSKTSGKNEHELEHEDQRVRIGLAFYSKTAVETEQLCRKNIFPTHREDDWSREKREDVEAVLLEVPKHKNKVGIDR